MRAGITRNMSIPQTGGKIFLEILTKIGSQKIPKGFCGVLSKFCVCAFIFVSMGHQNHVKLYFFKLLMVHAASFNTKMTLLQYNNLLYTLTDKNKI